MKGGVILSKWKSLIGIVLILLSLAGLIFWERQGREIFLMEPVLVAAKELPPGERVTRDSFMEVPVPAENKVEGAFAKGDGGKLIGSYAKAKILKNQQLAPSYFSKERENLEEGNAIFVIPREWISMRSSSLRRGDRVALYGSLSFRPVGVYRTAFVKDETEREVTAPDGMAKPQNVLERTDGTAEISHLELVTSLEEYEKIRQAAAEEQGLLIVQVPAEVASGE